MTLELAGVAHGDDRRWRWRWRMDGRSARWPSQLRAVPIAGAPAVPSEGGGAGTVAWMAKME